MIATIRNNIKLCDLLVVLIEMNWYFFRFTIQNWYLLNTEIARLIV